MDIITFPSETLRKKSKKIVTFSDPDLKSFANELLETMKKKDGIGLAAPQVGKNIKMIAVNTKEGDQVFVNPKIIWKSFFKKEPGEEGCLSFPKIYGTVSRSKKVWIKYQNLEGKKVNIKTVGLLARIFQHEIDHLKGVLFIDKVKEITKGKDLLKNMKNEKE